MMTTVKLYGKLGKLFGRTWHLDVNSPREAVCAIDANRPGLAAYLTRNSLPGYHVIVGDRDRDESELELATVGRTIKIIPYVKGKSSGWAKVVIGAVLVIIGTYYKSPASPYLINAGISMIFGGVAQLLTKPPTLEQPNEHEKSRPSYSFDGPVNTTAQGWPMPVGYGTLRIGGALVSMSIEVEDVTGGTDEPDRGEFAIAGYDKYTVSVWLAPFLRIHVVNGLEPIQWSILSQSAGNFFTITAETDTTWASISWVPTLPPLGNHILSIHAEDGDTPTQTTTRVITLNLTSTGM